MALELTAVFRKVPRGYMAFVEELPGANTQGETLDEVQANLREAVEGWLSSAHDAAVQRPTEPEQAR